MAKRQVPHEITLVALTQHDDGTLSVVDIVETSYRHASFFYRSFRRHYPEVKYVEACRPGSWRGQRREIVR